MKTIPAKWLDEPALLTHDGAQLRLVDLPALFGEALQRLPLVLRLLLENVVRNMHGSEREVAVNAILDWLRDGTSEAEIAFQPSRVLMHDTTSTPALVDIAGMRDALAEAGVDPSRLNPVLPVDVSIDHSLAVEFFAQGDAAPRNMAIELRRNHERYGFLRWASKVLRDVRIHPPGTGIMHTINLEQLATVVTTVERDGVMWVVPDTLLGTDSHTPMINGIGVLGWGVGGLEAQMAMFGMPVILRIPDVIGVRLRGRLAPGVFATDLALTVTQRLRAQGVAGEFVEFFGPGVATLTAGERAVVANMAPEYGASSGFFGVDARTLDYLRDTGRSETQISLVEAFVERLGLGFDPAQEPRYTCVVDIDIGLIGMHVAGPRRPQDLLGYAEIPHALRTAGGAAPQVSPAPRNDPPGNVLPRYPVVIAAITSCTNTSDPALLIAAGLVARKARAFGLKAPAWVKTSLGPGSPAAASYLARAGLLDDLSAAGFDIVGYGCTTCIGNSGPLTGPVQQALNDSTIRPVAMLSGNRNFAGRIHPDLDLGFIMSPPLVVVFGLAGDAEIELGSAPVQIAPDGRPVYLKDLWPTHEEIAAHVRLGADPLDYARDFDRAGRNPAWQALPATDTPLFPWRAASTTLRRPPFTSFSERSLLGEYDAYPLLVLGDDVTTDHISPASAIPKNSFIADFLVEQGDSRDDLNVFASRRGNWEVMIRGAFYSKTLVNHLCPGAPVGQTLYVPEDRLMPIFEAAQRYSEAGHSVVLIAGERYGTGSSRDWAAKGQRLLGIRAVLAVSFERIHRSNLIGMGILPLRLPAGIAPATLNIQPGDKIEIDAAAATLTPRCIIAVRIRRANGELLSIDAIAAVETQLDVALLQAGGAIPLILRNTLEAAMRQGHEPRLVHTRPHR
jgi:aconitate hydratase